ncbi:hypothetical protein PC129_g21278 [Phytophthora cactorum]|uniref:Uncharacterized protein n=1 Tax=Phytophthora cactorum TaxID=29920 RepID=A0A329S5N0_9STRA|nr:hypothetical protein Pcac1_g18815 [Phytophthora cactorum]KAG2810124.1 hypothetical protein PC112_g16189 [Phytophthora cactorum]KAG2827284.1 hypothetical protein PC111_g8640 [Phytophthora cactorum]KAG2852101.1 hypothetical protein PC113_g15327 [Phytophthora cactorum]KAG2890644.1 hypothetical protein PC114_g17355 [Phytophthora cactorum]
MELIRDWPVSRPKQELQSFLGTCVYGFYPDFAKLPVLLIDLTKGRSRKDPVEFNNVHHSTFEALMARFRSPFVILDLG